MLYRFFEEDKLFHWRFYLHKVNLFYFYKFCFVHFQQPLLITQTSKCPNLNVPALIMSISGVFTSLILHLCPVGYHL